jgi:hypothetical protein
VAPIGPRLQALGERFALALGQPELAGRTVIWLTLPRAVPPAQVLDPFHYDPEAEGEPEALLAGAPIRWAMATSYRGAGSSVVHRCLLYVPADAVTEIEALLERLRR